jgi:very-short-patch-repair endonuclease
MPPVRRQISPYAARLRRERTDAEDRFWQAVRNRQLDGFKIRFQHSIGRFVVDFACIEARLIVEIDGGQHSEEKDASRTAFLKGEGYRVIRFWNNDVLTNLAGVLEAVHTELVAGVEEEEKKKKTLTQPSPASGRGLEEGGSQT